jgi:predicted transcriptional regulator
MLVKEIMTPNPITVNVDMEIFKAAKILLDQRINGVPVVDAAGTPVGILCQSDIIAPAEETAGAVIFLVSRRLHQPEFHERPRERGPQNRRHRR